MGIGEKLLVGLASELGTEGVKAATKKFLSQSPDFKEPVINFGLFSNFKDILSYDTVLRELNEIIRLMKPRGRKLEFEKHKFEYDVSFDIIEGCEVPELPWEYDALVEPDSFQDSFDDSIAACCISGFIFWLSPLSLGDKKEMMISAYHLLKIIDLKLQESMQLPIMKLRSFIFIGADEETCLRIRSKLSKKMAEEKLLGNISLESLTDKSMLLVVPLREMLTVIALANSFKRWRWFS